MHMLAKIGSFLGGIAAIIALIGGVIFFLVQIFVVQQKEELQQQIDFIKREICSVPSVVSESTRLCDTGDSDDNGQN